MLLIRINLIRSQTLQMDHFELTVSDLQRFEMPRIYSDPGGCMITQ